MLDMPLNGIKLEKNAFSLVLRSLTLHEKQTSQMSRLVGCLAPKNPVETKTHYEPKLRNLTRK